MEKLRHYLINMPNKSTRQTLCIMPQTKERPTSFHEIMDKNFWIINGQHSVEASKTMQDMDVPQSTREFFLNVELLYCMEQEEGEVAKDLCILQPHQTFNSFKLIWSTNILVA